MRCPDCNKFVPFEDDPSNAEVNADVEVDEETGELDYSSLSVRLPRLCGECSTELTEYNFEDFNCEEETAYGSWVEGKFEPFEDVRQKIEELESQVDSETAHQGESSTVSPADKAKLQALQEELEDAQEELAELGNRPTFEIEMGDVEVNDFDQTKDRHGKPIKNFRYMKHMFEVTVGARVNCSDGDSFDLSFTSDAVPASAFEEIC